MKKLFAVFSVCAVLFIGGCGAQTTSSQPSTTPTPSPTASASNSPNPSAEHQTKTSFNVDWNKCFTDMKPHILGGDYDYVQDVYIKVDDTKKSITLTAVFGDATKPELAPEYADMVMRQFNTMAQMQDSSIKGGSKDYRGGIYDVYQTQIGIAPASKQKDTSKWFVFDTVPALAQTHEIKLQAAYR